MNLPFDLLHIFPPLLFFISFFGMMTSRNAIKAIIFIILMQTAVIILWLGVGASHGTLPPILSAEQARTYNFYGVSDPLPQALMLTAIVIGISVTAIIIIMLNSLFRKHHSTDWDTLKSFAMTKKDFLRKGDKAC